MTRDYAVYQDNTEGLNMCLEVFNTYNEAQLYYEGISNRGNNLTLELNIFNNDDIIFKAELLPEYKERFNY